VPDFLLTFLDGEVMTAAADLIDFQRPVLNLTLSDPGGNNREMTVPLSSLKYVVFGGEEEQVEDVERLTKVVIHFVDHEVIRAYASRDHLGGDYGIIYSLLDPERQVRRQLGVPYSAVKAIFKVKSWDSRGRSEGKTFARVARILADREDTARAERAGQPAPRHRKTPLMDRTRK
jgi:hypothetical protein